MFRGLEPPARNLLILYISFVSKVMKQSPRCCLLGGFAAFNSDTGWQRQLFLLANMVEKSDLFLVKWCPNSTDLFLWDVTSRWWKIHQNHIMPIDDTSSIFTQKSFFFSITHLWELPSPPPRFKVPRMGCGGAAQQRSPTTGASKSDTWIHVWGTKWLDPAFWVNSSICGDVYIVLVKSIFAMVKSWIIQDYNRIGG